MNPEHLAHLQAEHERLYAEYRQADARQAAAWNTYSTAALAAIDKVWTPGTGLEPGHMSVLSTGQLLR